VSRSFLGIPTFPLQTKVVGQPLLLAKKSSFPPTVVPVTIDWTKQFSISNSSPNVGVEFNLLTSAVKQQIDIIQSVYIDNTNSPIPIYVHFPSTGMTISVAPATSDWFPAVTQDLLVQVFALGLVVGQIPMTQIMFTNVLVNPYSDPELNFAIAQGLASPSITRGNSIFNTNFGIAALGDQTINFVDTIQASTANGTVLHDNLFDTPQAGFIYLTHIDVSGINNSAELVRWSLNSVASGGTTLYTFDSNHIQANQFSTHLRLSAMNIKFDASKTWRLQVINNNLSGTNLLVIETTLVWTENPN
jgi:hypothetical protein